MKKSYRSSAVALAASLAMVAFSSAQAFAGTPTVAQYLANDNVKTVPASQLAMGGSSFDANLVNADYPIWTGQDQSGKNAASLSAYQSHSSGTGRANLMNGTYQIGFSDVPLNAAGQDTADTTAYAQIPVALGGVSLIYNITFDSQHVACQSLLNQYGLNLSGVTVGHIFDGSIKSWGDSQITATNPKLVVTVGKTKTNCLTLSSSETIKLLSRTAGSGTTFILQDYLNAVDSANFPYPTSNAFSAAVATESNSAAMAPAVAGLPGAFGYVEQGYGIQNSLKSALVGGVADTVSNVAADATQGLKLINASTCNSFSTDQPTTYVAANVNTQCFTIVNSGKGYPIAGFSYAIVAKHQADEATAETIAKFLLFLAYNGQGNNAINAYYTPLPAAVQAVALTKLKEITYSRNGVATQALSTTL